MTKPSWIRWNYRTTNAFTKQTNGTPTIQYSILYGIVWLIIKAAPWWYYPKLFQSSQQKIPMIGRSSRFFSWVPTKGLFSEGFDACHLCVLCGLFFQVRWRCKAWQRPLKRPWRTVPSRQRSRGESAVRCASWKGCGHTNWKPPGIPWIWIISHIWYLIDWLIKLLSSFW